MLRLVYRTGVFGPLHFEYTKRRVRVGSCRDNDLVVPHPSVQPYHCTLAIDEDSLAVLPPHTADEEPVDGARRYGAGDRIMVGELAVEIERSPNSVGVPVVDVPGPPAGRTAEGYWLPGFEDVPDTARWFCVACQMRFEDEQVRVIGLAGRRRHVLCPVCSQHVAFVRADAARSGALAGKVRRWWRSLWRNSGRRR